MATLPVTVRRVINPYGRLILPDRILPHIVDVYRNQDIRLDAGDRVPVDLLSMAPIFRRVPCWVQPTGAMQVLEFQRLDLPIILQITMLVNPGIRNGDYLLFQRYRQIVIEGIENGLEVDMVWKLYGREIT